LGVNWSSQFSTSQIDQLKHSEANIQHLQNKLDNYNIESTTGTDFPKCCMLSEIQKIKSDQILKKLSSLQDGNIIHLPVQLQPLQNSISR